MKSFRTSAGRLPERPHFTPNEIERTCADELRKVGLYPSAPKAIRIERFIEKRFGVSPEYDDLPDGVLGYTKFGLSGVEAIVVARALDSEGGTVSERRVRTTLAHEAGHGLFHAYLFALAADAQSLFDQESCHDHQVLCRDVPVEQHGSRAYDGRWWEYQANKAIGGLLMPRPLVKVALEPYLIEVGTLGAVALDPRAHETTVRRLADIFEVNPVVARIRINDIFPADRSGQLSL
jgi:hypothetical protein